MADEPLKPLMPLNRSKIASSHPPYGLMRASAADWALVGPEGKNDAGGPVRFYRYKVTSKDSWASLAKLDQYADPKELVRLNFWGIDHSPYVNYLMLNYIGCTHTRDGINCSFSDNLNPGIIWRPRVPATPWPPAWDKSPPNCSVVQMSPSQILRHRPNRTGVVPNLGRVSAGMRLLSPEGVRLIISISPAELVFVLLEARAPQYQSMVNKVFHQQLSACGANDLVFGPFAEVHRRTEFLKTAGEVEISILMGLLGGGGKWIAAGLMWTKLGDFFLSSKKDQALYLGKALVDIYKALLELRKTSPELFDLLVEAFFGQVWNDFKNLTSPNWSAVAGTLIGTYGPEVLSGRLTAGKFLTDTFKHFVDVAKSQAGAAVDQAKKKCQADALGYANQLQKYGVQLSKDRTDLILDELIKNPQALATALQKISAAVAPLK